MTALGSSVVEHIADDHNAPSLVRIWIAGCELPSLPVSKVLLTGGLGDVMLYAVFAVFGSVAHFAGCQQMGCAITAHIPAISGPSQARVRQLSDTIMGSLLLLLYKRIFSCSLRVQVQMTA